MRPPEAWESFGRWLNVTPGSAMVSRFWLGRFLLAFFEAVFASVSVARVGEVVRAA